MQIILIRVLSKPLKVEKPYGARSFNWSVNMPPTFRKLSHTRTRQLQQARQNQTASEGQFFSRMSVSSIHRTTRKATAPLSLADRASRHAAPPSLQVQREPSARQAVFRHLEVWEGTWLHDPEQEPPWELLGSSLRNADRILRSSTFPHRIGDRKSWPRDDSLLTTRANPDEFQVNHGNVQRGIKHVKWTDVH